MRQQNSIACRTEGVISIALFLAPIKPAGGKQCIHQQANSKQSLNYSFALIFCPLSRSHGALGRYPRGRQEGKCSIRFGKEALSNALARHFGELVILCRGCNRLSGSYSGKLSGVFVREYCPGVIGLMVRDEISGQYPDTRLSIRPAVKLITPFFPQILDCITFRSCFYF